MNPTIFVVLYLLFVASLETSGEAITPSRPYTKCSEWMSGFVQTKVWHDTGSQIIISAERGCASRVGRPLEMENVDLTIVKDDQKIANFKTKNGVFSRDQNRLILGSVSNNIQNKQIQSFQALLVDLDSGVVRAPHSFYLKLTK